MHEGALCGWRVVCPWHQSVFDVSRGTLHEPPSLDGLAYYPVRIDGDDVFITLPDAPPPPAPPFVVTDHRRTILVVGAGAAGQVAVENVRKQGFAGRVILVGPEPEPPYDRTNLTKHFLSGQARREDLPLRRDLAFFQHLGIERRVAAVEWLDVQAKSATLTGGETIRYDAAILASGAQPKRLGVPGEDHPRVCPLRSVADAERILAFLPEKDARVVAVGASFIGLEAVSSLAQRGVQVTVLSPDEIPFARQLGPEIGGSIRRLHERHGVRFLPGARVAGFEDAADADGLQIRLADGSRLTADAAIVGVGVRPATDFVQGGQRAPDGGMVVTSSLLVGHELYAAGDVANFPLPDNIGDGGRARIEHWRVAQQHAVIAARNAARGARRRYVLNHWSSFVPFFWTFHFGQRMNYVGYAPRWDEIIFDGDPAEPPFIAYYLHQGRVLAAAGTHRDADLAAMHELLRVQNRHSAPKPTAEQLRAGGFSPVGALW